MSTQPTPATGGAQPMSQADLEKLIADNVSKSVGPAVDAALAPFAKAQSDVFGRLAAALPGQKDEPTVFDESIMGKHRFGRKALAVALAALEGVPADDMDGICKVVKKHWMPSIHASVEKWAVHVKTTLSAGIAATAGDMVMPSMDPEWIELLRNNAVVRSIARTIPMPTGATTRRRQTGASTAAYQGELGPTTPSNLTVNRVNLSNKKLRALTVVSNDLIRFAGPEAERMVQEDLLRVSALREDRAFLVGNPPIDSGSPQGIRFQTTGSNIAASAGTSLANFQTDFTGMISSVQTANIPASPSNSYFIMSPATFWVMYALATTTGDMIFAAMLGAAQPRIFGFPVLLTTQLGVANSFIGASSGLVIFCYAPALEIHDSMSRTVEGFRGGAYVDDTNTMRSGISNDETVITCTSEHDFFQTYDVAAAIRTGYAT